MEISVLIPVYNEAENIIPLVDELEQALEPWAGKFEVIFVDDGSSDAGPSILKQLVLQKSWMKVISFRRNTGQTAAFDAGFRSATGKVIVTMDSDLQNDPADIPKMMELMNSGYDFVSGWRKNRKDGFFLRTFPSRIANWIIRKATGTGLHDLGCSLKAYRRELSDELRLYGEMHRFIGVFMENLGAKVAEIEVHHRPRIAGESKYNLVRTFKVLIDLVTVWFMQGYRTKPSYLFGGVGFTLIGSSALVALFVLWQKFYLGAWVHRNPVFIIAVMLLILGVQFVVFGLLGEILIRIYFETSRSRPYLISQKLGFSLPEPVNRSSRQENQPCAE